MDLFREFVFLLLSLCLPSWVHPAPPSVSRGLLYYNQLDKTRGHYSVSYDERSFIINGSRTLLLSGAVHYPRVWEGEWSATFDKMVDDGLNAVQTYVYWNLHEPRRGEKYDFSGNRNWTLFVEKAAQAGLFVNLRIGPFVASEWDYGGIPYWVHSIPGMVVRSSNAPWQKEMERFFKDMVEVARPYLATNGGPIILMQIENEFHWEDPEYIKWCGSLVDEVKAGIPFIMCNGYSANNTINTCNGNDCAAKYSEGHASAFPGQPLVWTEDEGWFQSWDKQPLAYHDNRTAEDMAYVILKWFARGASHHNYYMWYGGNNFGRYSAGACITTMYCDGVNLHSDGLRYEPKATHLARLHFALASYAKVLLSSPSQIDNKQKVLVYDSSIKKFVPAVHQYAFIYSSGGEGIALVENEANKTATVLFMGNSFELPPLSSSMVDLRSVREVFNSGKVNSEGLPTRRTYSTLINQPKWSVWQEDITHLKGGTVQPRPLEQLNLTQDLTDYLFYQRMFTAAHSGSVDVIIESRISNSFLVYLDGQLQAHTETCKHTQGPTNYSVSVSTTQNTQHNLTLLSVSLGVSTHTEPGEFDLKGITGRVLVGGVDLTQGAWLHRPQLEGERLLVYTAGGMKNVSWSPDASAYAGKSLVWYRFYFDQVALKPASSLLLDLQGMGRGWIFLNGVNLGRYWLTMVNGEYVQRYYYVPVSMLLKEDNALVLFEEYGATTPQNVKLVASTFVSS